MKQKDIKTLMPQFVRDFNCIGSECEDSCCMGWRVDIDRKTYKKYREIKNKDLGFKLNKYVKRNRSENSNDECYAKIKLENNECPLLSKDKLCIVQLEKGQSYLSKVCTTYPRIINMLNDSCEKSLVMSCPEAVRIALLNPNTIEFDEIIEKQFDNYLIAQQIKLEENNWLAKYFWDLRVFTINLIQNRKYELWERLIILGLFIQKIQEKINLNKLSDITEVINTFSRYINNDIFNESLKEIPTKLSIQISILNDIINIRNDMGICSERYSEIFNELINGIGYKVDISLQQLEEKYKDAYEKHYISFVKEKSYILENYLVNYIFKSMFPLTGEKNIFDLYMMLIIHYSLLKMHLIGVAAYNKGLDDNKIVKVIQSFSKTIEHNVNFIETIEKNMVQSNYNNMAYMSILIKN